jgi:hypothetical protein
MADMRPQGEIRPRTTDDPGHEAETISVRGVFTFAVGLVVLGVVINLVLGLAMGLFSARESRNQAARPSLLATPVEPPPHGLQGNPPVDRAREQERQLADLNSYGWVDREAGIVHIPVARAMDILAERGLPEIKDEPGPFDPVRSKAAETPAAKPAEKSDGRPARKAAEPPAEKPSRPAPAPSGTGKRP